MVFLDCEATGLQRVSHPLSAGLAWCDGRSQGMLIRPSHLWSDVPWDAAALQIHRITPAVAAAQGRGVAEVAAWLNAQCRGMTVVSDAPEWEAHWLGKLFSAAGVQPAFALASAAAVAHQAIRSRLTGIADEALNPLWRRSLEAAAVRYPHTHVAEEDALGVAMAYRHVAGYGLGPN